MNEQLKNSNQWEERLENWQQSGLSIRAWCNQQNIGEQVFYYWRNKLKGKPSKKSPPSFIELINQSPKTGIKLQIKTISIHLSKGFDKATLLECIKLLKDL